VRKILNNEDWQKIKGIGVKTAEKLVAKGVKTVEEVAVMTPAELAQILGTSIAKAKEVINNAKELILTTSIAVMTGEEFKKIVESKIQKIPTGISRLDRVLDGGIPTNALIGFGGQSATGKTEICYSLAVNCVKHLGRPFIWIETEPGVFSITRLLQIARARGVEINLGSDMYIIPADYVTNPAKQMMAYELADRKAEEMGVKPGLLVVDSFSAKIREYYTGREMLSARSQEVARHIGYLQMLASKYNMAIALTEQVYGVPDISAQRAVMARLGDTRMIYGGEFLLHSVTMQFTLVRTGRESWSIILADVPGKPMIEIPFKISEEGVTDA